MAGAQQYAQQLGNMAQQTAAFAQQTQSATVAAAALALQAQAAGVQLFAWVRAGEFVIDVLRDMTQSVMAGMRAWGQYNDELARTTILSQNMGNATGAFRLREFAFARQQQTGIGEGSTLELVRRLTAQGFSQRLIPQAVRTLQDVEASGLGSADQVANLMNRILRREAFAGQLRGGGSGLSRPLASIVGGIDPRQFTGDPQRDVITILREISRKVGDTADLLRQTPEGSLNAVQQNFNTLMARLAGLLETGIQPILEFLATQFAGMIRAVDLVTHALASMPKSVELALSVALGPIMGPLFHSFIEALRRQDTNFGREARENKNARNFDDMRGYLQQIAQRPGSVQFGHLSAQNQQALSFLQFSQAMGVRPG